uniref:UPAR/Ly6 domain-containing protein n=1 Tax=Parascaris univalens TaxID=6257 RepID=A0A915C5L7_PARUN
MAIVPSCNSDYCYFGRKNFTVIAGRIIASDNGSMDQRECDKGITYCVKIRIFHVSGSSRSKNIIDYEARGCNTAVTPYDCKIGGSGCRTAMYRFGKVGTVYGTLCCCDSHLCNHSATTTALSRLLVVHIIFFFCSYVL